MPPAKTSAAAGHGNEKPPPVLTPESRRAAIKRECQRLDALIEAERKDNPDAAHWRRTDELFQAKGHTVRGSALRPLVAIPVRIAEKIAGVEDGAPKPTRVTDAEIDSAAEHWEAASQHLGLSESGAALLGAIGATLGTVGLAVGRALAGWWSRRSEPAEELPVPAGAQPQKDKP